MVCKLFSTVTNAMASALFVLASCFERVTIVKPVTSRPGNAERYVVCESRRAHCDDAIDVLAQAAAAAKAGDAPPLPVADALPSCFTAWLC